MRDPYPPLLHCYRCVYSWRPRKGPPRICPRCKSKLWNVPKTRLRTRGASGLGPDRVIGPYLSEIRRLALRHNIGSLRLFGSVARGEATPKSDVDLLYTPTRPITLIERVQFRLELEKLLGRRVDLCREAELKWSVKPQAMAEAVTL